MVQAIRELGIRNRQLGITAAAIAASAFSSFAQIPGPQGTHTENGLAGYAKILCSGVFISGRTPEDVAQGSAYFFMPAGERDRVKWSVDRDAKRARASIEAGGQTISRQAALHGDQGCIIDNPAKPGIHFTPAIVRSRLPDAASQDWPMGDRIAGAPWPAGVDKVKIDAALDAAFADPAAQTAAFLVVHKGRILGERYAPGITKDTQLESWSMGKSLAATLFGLLVQDGTYTLEQAAPVALWQKPGDPRAAIRNIDLLRMSAGLKFLGNQEAGSNATYPDHYYIYTGAIDAFDYSITRPQEYPPNTDGRYRNSDPLAITYLIKQAVTKRGDNILTWPQRALFDRIGIRRQVLETDPYGNFLISGYDYGTARNWARIGMLYLQDGMWQGQRILPEGWATFVSTPAPAWRRPEYGGFFWLNRVKTWNLPEDAYFAAGAGGQNTWIVPSLDLVIVRMGHMRGQGPARAVTNRALGLVAEAVQTPAPPAAAAPFVLPKPTGPHPVGTTTFWSADLKRRNSFAGDETRRILAVHAWYPSELVVDGFIAPYLREGLDEVRSLATLMKAPGAYDALANVRTHAYLNAPLMRGVRTLPVLVFSHGYTGFPSAATSLVEDLASHGYLVLSIVRPYESGAMKLADGRVVSFVEYGAPRAHVQEVFKEWADEDAMMASVTKAQTEAEQLRIHREYFARIPKTYDVVARWADDIKFVLSGLPHLGTMQPPISQLALYADVQRVGVVGHSMGGVASGQFCTEDSRCAGGINLDGIPQSGRVIDETSKAPFLMVYSARPGRAGANDAIYRRAFAQYRRVDVPDTLHPDFSDMILWGGPLRDRGAFGTIAPERAIAETRRLVREFFDRIYGKTPSSR